MDLSRRKFMISAIGTAICAGVTPTFVPKLIDPKASVLPTHLSSYMIENQGLSNVYLGIKGLTKNIKQEGYTLRPGEQMVLPSRPGLISDPAHRGGIYWQVDTSISTANTKTKSLLDKGLLKPTNDNILITELEEDIYL